MIIDMSFWVGWGVCLEKLEVHLDLLAYDCFPLPPVSLCPRVPPPV